MNTLSTAVVALLTFLFAVVVMGFALLSTLVITAFAAGVSLVVGKAMEALEK